MTGVVSLQNKISDLHECRRGNGGIDAKTGAEKANNLIGDIGHLCLQDITEKELGFACSLLFDRENGLLTFLRQVALMEEFVNCKASALEFLLAFLNKVEKKVLPYAVDLKDVCVSLFRDRFSKVKNATFPVLIKLLELTTGSKMGTGLKVQKMIEKYFMELTQTSKTTATVKQGIYTLLGVFCKVYPELMVNYSERLLSVYMMALKEQMTSNTKKTELSIISGCFAGLTHYLVNFTQSAEEGAKHSYDIFNYARKALNPNIQVSRFQMVREALELFAKHGQQFGQYLIEDYQTMYERFSHWGNHNNREVAPIGHRALETFLKQIADMLVHKAKRGTEDRQTFQYFIQRFCDIMNNNNADVKQVSLAIRGYGYFAAPCKIFMSSEDVKFMFAEMIQRSEQLFFNQNEVVDDKIHNLPSFVEALASIVREMDEVSDPLLVSMERLVVILIENFHKFNQNTNFICIKSILKVLVSLSPKGATFRGFLSRTVYQGLIRTCSHPVVVEIEQDETVDQEFEDRREKKISYKDYLPLWESLLNVEQHKDLIQMGLSVAERKMLLQAFYDEIMSAVLRILEKLDLTSVKPESDQAMTSDASPDLSAAGDPVVGLSAAKPKDFQILINLVDICRDLLPFNHYDQFERWMFTFGHQVILLSTKYPLVSGFYKLLATCMTICNKLIYFQDIESNREESSMDAVSGDGKLRAEKEYCFVLFTKFTEEVLVRMKQYKDDLLASCLVFILALPQEIVKLEIKTIVPALKTAFKLGLSYLPLAMAGLDALDQWTEHLPASVIQPYYKEILPCLDAYLKTTADQGQEGSTPETMTIPPSGRSTKSRKIPLKLLKSMKKKDRTQSKKYVSQLAVTKQRIVKLLGAVGGCNNSWLVTTTAADTARLAVAWDTEKHLKFDMPFMDIKPTIYFDAFLPRIVELATTSSDRQTKVAASELFHSMVLYMLGRSAQQPGERQERFPMHKLYRKVFPVVLQLACDVEQVSRQLFETLMMQLIHWFTGNKTFESEDTVALLDAILDGVIHPTDTALRDFSAKCMKEFLRWSIKQTSKKMQEKSPLNTKSLLKRLYSLSLHPNAFKRMGAALAFNSIYQVFREEDSLVDIFTFEILANYVDSLAIAHQDDKSLGTQEQSKKVLTHLERIIKVKADVFMKESKTRRTPREWNKATLDIAVRWLMRQCGRPQTECRHACMELVYTLAPCIKGIKNPQHLFKAIHKQEGAPYFLIRFEGGGYKLNHKSGLARYPTLHDLEGSFTLKATLHWFDLLLAALDCYTWVFGQDLLVPSELLTDKGTKVTCIFKSLDFFLTKLALGDIEAAVKQFSAKSDRSIFTPKEIEDYNKGKCTVMVRLLDFIVVMVGKHPQDSLKVIPVAFWCSEFWQLVCCVVLEPSRIGFNMGDVEVMMNLPDQVCQLLQVLGRRLPQENLNKFKNELSGFLLASGSSRDLFGLLPLSLSDTSVDFMQLMNLVSGYEQLHKGGLLQPYLTKKKTPGAEAGTKLLNFVFRAITQEEEGHRVLLDLTPTATDLAQRLLQLAFVFGIKATDLLDLLFESTLITSAEGKVAARYGSVFYTSFKSSINQYIITYAADFIGSLMKKVSFDSMTVANIVQSVLDQVTRDRNLRKTEGVKVSDALLQHWHCLTPWWKETKTKELKTAVLTIFNKVLLIDSKVTSDVNHKAFREIFDMYCHLLTDPSTHLTFKSQVLNLLFFYTNLPEKETAQLKSSLDRFVADNFPLKSTEFAESSPQYNDYVGALGKILNSLELSGSLMLLELLISIMCREVKHSCEDELQNSIAVFTKRLPTDKQKFAIDVPYKIFLQEDSYPNEIRRAALERVCIPMMRLVHTAAVREFFMDHIKNIVGCLEARQSKSSEGGFETQLVTKIGCFELVEVLFSSLPKDDINSKSSAINQRYCGNNPNAAGNELTIAITKAAHQAKKEDVRGETMLIDLRRQFHCAAYNTLIAVVSCTKTEIKFYDAFLFSDNPKKGEFLLDNIIDKEKRYKFERELESPIARKKKFVSIRQGVRESRLDDFEGESGPVSIHYLASQYLADSSLSDEVSQFDRLSSAQSYSSTFEKDVDRRMKGRDPETISGAEIEASTVVKEDYVEMEMDELNQHECMATMTALIQHMDKSKITPTPQKGTVPDSMPGWMSHLQKKFTDPAGTTNIRLFIARLIINAQEVFQPYAKFWLGPLVQFVVTDYHDALSINYMLVDIVVTMLSWATVAIPEDTVSDRAMASSLVEFLMKYCHHETRAILKNNLEMLKTLVECWRDRVDIPVKVIFDHLNKPDPKDNSSATGIQLLGVVVANNLPPYRDTMTVDRDRYYQVLANNLMKNSKPIHTAAGEVVGMTLKYVAEKDKPVLEPYQDYIHKILSSLHQGKPDQFINCVHRIQLHYPPIADRFTTKLLFMLPSLHGDFKTLCLEVILKRIDNIQDVFMELKNKGLLDLLSHRDEATQNVSLRIVHAMLKSLSPKDLLYLLPSVVSFSSNPSKTCRITMFEILMWIYDNYREEESEEGHEILSQTKDTLLKGLMDEDINNRLTIQNFWSHETRLPTGTLDRMVAMLEAMYAPSTESQYLSYATNLLLEMTSKSPDYNREIFEHPLSECKFMDYNVSSSWRQRHAGMTPLFVETFASQTGISASLDDTMGSDALRATQGVQQFTPTQDVASKAPYNWLTQSSLDTFSNISMSLSMADSQTQQSSLLFTVGKAPPKQRKPRPKLPAGFGKERLGADSSKTEPKPEESERENELKRLKRRFIKDQSSTNTYFARRAMAIKNKREETLKEQRAKREFQVTLYRKYRIGDLPDIQIKYSYIIAPLQALAQRDSTIAKMLFSAIFRGIFLVMDTIKTEREVVETTQQISQCLNDMLANSMNYFPPFIACVQDIAFNLSKQLKLQPSTINTCSVTSLQQPLGIVLLEEQLLKQGGSAEPPTKKRRGGPAQAGGTTVSLETGMWIELARVYKSLGDYDVLRGIFSGMIDTKEITHNALEAEARGDFATAVKLYNEAISCESWDDGRPQEVEVDLWDDCRLKCFNHLTQWDNLEEFSVTCIDESDTPQLDKVWEDTYYQDHYLPFIIRSKLKLMVEGDENQQGLLSFIDQSMKTSERKAFLETRFSEELALMYLWQEDYDRARYYADNALQLFLQDWSSIDTLMLTSRTTKLQGLQKITELQEFLEFMKYERNFQSCHASVAVVDKWLDRKPDVLMDPSDIWDDIVTNRCVFIEHLGKRLESQRLHGEIHDAFETKKVLLRLSQADSAREQNNFPLALKLLKSTHKNAKASSDESLLIQWTHTYCQTHQRKVHTANGTMTLAKKLESLLSSMDQLQKLNNSAIFKCDNLLSRRHDILQGLTLDMVASEIYRAQSLEELSESTLDKIFTMSTMTGCKKKTLSEVMDSLVEKGYSYMENAKKSAVKEEASEMGAVLDVEGIVEAHMTLFRYCDKYLCLNEEDDDAAISSPSMKLFPQAVVTSLLSAMKLDSKEARQKFARLLQIVETYSDTLSTFSNKAKEIPCWMFISWISQMVSLLDKKEAKAVQDILVGISESYPQALIYPLKISSESFEFDNSTSGKQNKAAVEKLQATLSQVPLVNTFIAALEQFGQPNALFGDWVDDMKKLLDTKSRDKAKIQHCYKEFFAELMDHRGSMAADSSLSLYDGSAGTQICMGPYRKRFAQAFVKEVETLVGSGGTKLAGMSPQEFSKKANDLKRKMGEQVGSKLKPPMTLKEYSPWMYEFKAANYEKELEIPGQYTGTSKPMPEYHTKISGFDERVLVLASIRKPKRIIIRGNDEKDYYFLVKGGEDLRQDQRIEQLFCIMNEVFQQDPACRQRKLVLRTYQVIPMTPRLGLIEWVLHTTPLKDFQAGAMTKAEAKFAETENGAKNHQFVWVNKFGPAKEAHTLNYGHMYTKASKTETVKAFREREGKVPWDLLRRAFLQMSSSPEAFFTLRSHFITSHALLCAAQYILGIGDRHLSNFMVDLETGGMVGIDFGHAFGSATQFLPVPELMPFRLTRQMVNLMMPMKEKGLFEYTMIHGLRAIRKDYDLLLNVMDVFIKDVSLDWIQNAERQKKEKQQTEDAAIDKAWFPKQKVAYAKRKLQGANSCHITRDELKLGHSHKGNVYKAYVSVCMGDRDNIRHKLPEKDLSVEDQVACLIDHATDPNILGRTYIGWEPWM